MNRTTKRVLVAILIFAIISILIVSVALLIYLLKTDKADKVVEHVNVFFSPAINETYYYKLKEFPDIVDNKRLRRDLPTVIYIHGFLDEGEKDVSALAIRGAYCERNDHNVITLDWSYYSKSFSYTKAVRQLKIVCETISEYLFTLSNEGFDINTVHLVGHSLGAQCSGLIGRRLKAISGEKLEISKIYALDPAGPGFEFFSYAIPFLTFDFISKSDAKYVQIVHTNGGISGMKESVGHADFYPNGGTDQSGCDLDPISTICNHRRAWYYYQESVRNPQGYPALKCDSYDDFKNNKCESNEIEFMGFGASGNKTGKFYLRTHSDMFRTALGVDGLNDRSLEASLEDGKHKKVIGFHFEESLTNIFKNLTSS